MGSRNFLASSHNLVRLSHPPAQTFQQWLEAKLPPLRRSPRAQHKRRPQARVCGLSCRRSGPFGLYSTRPQPLRALPRRASAPRRPLPLLMATRRRDARPARRPTPPTSTRVSGYQPHVLWLGTDEIGSSSAQAGAPRHWYLQ